MTVEALIERYRNADFNRRLDSYEIAGYMLYEVQTNEWKAGAVDYFNRFGADRYSAVQGDEIRYIIETAIKNRDRSAIVSEPAVNMNETAEIPVFSDKNIIESIIRNNKLLSVRRGEIAGFFEENDSPEKRSEYMKAAFDGVHTELDIADIYVGCKADNEGLQIWEGSFIARKSEAFFSWDEVQAMAADLLERGEFLDRSEVVERHTETVKDIAEAAEDEPVIVQNEIADVSDLPVLSDTRLIEGIIKDDRFHKIKRDKVAAFFEANEDYDKRCEFIKKAYNPDYSELDIGDTRVGYKASENGLLLWEGHFLSRTKEVGYSWGTVQAIVADLMERGEYLDRSKTIDNRTVAEYAEELEAGDIIRIDDDIWTVKTANAYMLSLENEAGEKKNYYNSGTSKWYDEVNEAGFEYISENEIDEPVFAVSDDEPDEPEPEQTDLFGEPAEIVEQLSMFGDDTPVQTVKKSDRPIAKSNTAPDDELINYALRSGGDEPKTLERIVAHFQKGKTLEENADFLRNEFKTGGKGYRYGTPLRAALLAEWFDKDGITLAISDTAFPEGEQIHLDWKQVSERISAMLERGDFCSQDIIDRAAEYDINSVAERLWTVHQDYDDKENPFFIPEDMFKGGFPDSTARIAASLLDKDTLQKYIDGMTALLLLPRNKSGCSQE